MSDPYPPKSPLRRQNALRVPLLPVRMRALPIRRFGVSVQVDCSEMPANQTELETTTLDLLLQDRFTSSRLPARPPAWDPQWCRAATGSARMG